jgi:hypothetical protein
MPERKISNLKELKNSNLSRAAMRKELSSNKKLQNDILKNNTKKMGMLDFIHLGKKDVKLPSSKASESDTEIAFSDATYFQKPEGKKQLEVMFRNCWPINRAITIRQNLKVARGFKISFDHMKNPKKAEEIVNEFLRKLHPTRPLLVLQNRMRDIGIATDVFGNGYWEKLYSPSGTLEKPLPIEKAKEINGIAPIHPIHLGPKRDGMGNIIFKNGNPESFIWKKDNTKYEVDPKRIAHLKYIRIADEFLGMSLIEPIYKTGERILKIEEGITQSILTHQPMYDIIVGDESHHPTQEMIDDTVDVVKGLNYMSEYVHPHWIRVSQMEAFSLGKSYDYLRPFLNAIATQTGVPEFLLYGKGEGTNKATAQAMKEFIYQTIEPLQQADAMFIEGQLFAPLMKLHKIDEVPMIEWNDITPQDALETAKIIQILSTTLIDGKPVIDLEQAQELLKLSKLGIKGVEKKDVKPIKKYKGIVKK